MIEMKPCPVCGYKTPRDTGCGLMQCDECSAEWDETCRASPWHPAREVPTESGTYFVVMITGFVKLGEWFAGTWMVSSYEDNMVTHWMEIPPCP